MKQYVIALTTADPKKYYQQEGGPDRVIFTDNIVEAKIFNTEGAAHLNLDWLGAFPALKDSIRIEPYVVPISSKTREVLDKLKKHMIAIAMEHKKFHSIEEATEQYDEVFNFENDPNNDLRLIATGISNTIVEIIDEAFGTKGGKVFEESAKSEPVQQTYIGTKIVKAWEAVKDGKEGYAVVYEDGYKSWSPKDIFERSYRAITNKERELL